MDSFFHNIESRLGQIKKEISDQIAELVRKRGGVIYPENLEINRIKIKSVEYDCGFQCIDVNFYFEGEDYFELSRIKNALTVEALLKIYAELNSYF